jgi:hypothetical protein
VSATAETRRLSAAEQTLVDRLPSGLVDTSSCTEAIDGESKYLIDTKTGLKAAVNCTPQTAGSAPQPDGKMTILQYTSATTYNSAVSDLKSGKTQGTCASTTPHQTTWSFTNADGSSGKSVGALACGFYSDSQYAWLSWTYDKDWVTMTVYGPTGGSSADIPNLDKFFLAAPVELSP